MPPVGPLSPPPLFASPHLPPASSLGPGPGGIRRASFFLPDLKLRPFPRPSHSALLEFLPPTYLASSWLTFIPSTASFFLPPLAHFFPQPKILSTSIGTYVPSHLGRFLPFQEALLCPTAEKLFYGVRGATHAFRSLPQVPRARVGKCSRDDMSARLILSRPRGPGLPPPLERLCSSLPILPL